MPPAPVSQPGRRSIDIDGERWQAYISGAGSYGTGHWGLGPIQAVHFARASAASEPVVEALLPARRLDDLFDDELIALFRTARPIVKFESGSGPAPSRRFSLGEDLP